MLQRSHTTPSKPPVVKPVAVASYPVMAGWASFAIAEWEQFATAFLAMNEPLGGPLPVTPFDAVKDLTEARKAWAQALAAFRVLVGDGYLGK